MKLTENEVVIIFKSYLEANGWFIGNYCLDGTRGIDILATKGRKTLIIEVKGERARDNAPTKKREFFKSSWRRNRQAVRRKTSQS